MIRGLFIVLILSVYQAQAAVYRSVDEEGNVTFTDQPSKGSERVKIPSLPTFTPPPMPRFSPTPTVTEEANKAIYEKFSIARPENDLAFWDNEGFVDVELLLEPGLQTGLGHKVVIYMVGEPATSPMDAMNFRFKDVDRGTHTLAAKVVDSDGKVLMNTGDVIFHLKRQSINFPNRNRPTPF